MRLLITGASGFLAKAFLETHGSDHDVTFLGRTDPNIQGVSCQAAHCDFSDIAAVGSALTGLENEEPFDAVIHMAVSRLHRTFPETAKDLFAVNVAVTAELLDFAHRTGAGHFILGSTGTVYNTPFGHRALETDLTPPKSYFAATKLAADHLAEQYRPHFPVSILRFFVPYGPGLDDRMLSNLANAIKAGNPVTIPIDGPPLTFAPIYRDDAVLIINTCLQAVWNETVNVAGPEAISIVEAGEIIANHYGLDLQVQKAQSALPFYLAPDLNRLHTLMGDLEYVTFANGMSEMLQVQFPDSHA